MVLGIPLLFQSARLVMLVICSIMHSMALSVLVTPWAIAMPSSDAALLLLIWESLSWSKIGDERA